MRMYILIRKVVFGLIFQAAKIIAYQSLRKVKAVLPSYELNKFIGYYDLRFDEKLFLLCTKYCGVRATSDAASIVSYCIASDEVNEIAETISWNWQQGCLLIPLANGGVAFNTYRNGQYNSVWFNDSTRRYFDRPHYDISPNNDYFIAIDFRRLAAFRPDYGYFCDEDNMMGLDAVLVCTKTGEETSIITHDWCQSELTDYDSMPSRVRVNHFKFSPDSKKFMFLLRWSIVETNHTRLYTYDVADGKFSLLNGDVMTSHCCWIDDNSILGFATVGSKTGYFLWNLESGSVTSIPWLPEEDGHPSISRDGKYLVTDTYPGRSRTSKLLIYDWTEQKVVQKLRIPQPIESNPEQRCDLHPKWLGTDTVVFESCHSGIRQLYTFRV